MVDKTVRFNDVALAFGAILTAWSAATIDERLVFIGSSVAVQGTVVRLTHGAHHPLIEFMTQRGERVSFQGSFVTAEVGDTVPVRHDPARPRASSAVDTLTNRWLESILSIAFTMAFLYAGLKGESLLPKSGEGAECGRHRGDAGHRHGCDRRKKASAWEAFFALSKIVGRVGGTRTLDSLIKSQIL